jgi:hypothetical protein
MLHRSEAARAAAPIWAGAQQLPASLLGDTGGADGEGSASAFGCAEADAPREAPDSGASEHRRYVRLVMSPVFPTNVVCPYVITAAGVRGEE